MQFHRRAKLFVALILTIVLGLLSRILHVGWFVWDKSVGDALYALAAYLCLALLFPTGRPRRVGFVALSYCVAIELFKFTGLPAAWASFRVSRLIFGTTPSWHNVLCYATAILLAVLIAKGRYDDTGSKTTRPQHLGS